MTPLGRQEDWAEPSGRSDGPFVHRVRRHVRFGSETAASPGTDAAVPKRSARSRPRAFRGERHEQSRSNP
jgi:hypothetical protein